MRRQIHPPAEMAEAEWDLLEVMFTGSIYLDTVKNMRAVKNVPQKACDVLPTDSVNQGHEMLNVILRREEFGLRFTRTETWTGGNRAQRKLAFVRWPLVPQIGKQLRFHF